MAKGARKSGCLRADGRLRKGYRYVKGGGIVKATTKAPVTKRRRKTHRNRGKRP